MGLRGGEHAQPEQAIGRANPERASEPAPTAGQVAVVLALQRSAGNRAVTRHVQRAVRINKGKTKINEAAYDAKTHPEVAALIADPVKRVFDSEAEVVDYAKGRLDYIGDVKTQKGDTFWFRLPNNKLTVLGEEHQNPDGNVEDVITGLKTKRFKYEAFNEIAPVSALKVPLTGTETRLKDVNKQYPAEKLTDRAKYDPDLENIIIKALTGAAMLRNEFPKNRDDPQWKKRASTNDYSFGDRVALYVSMAIHIAADLAAGTLPAAAPSDTAFIKSARALVAAYAPHKKELDAFMAAKDKDDLVGLYELTAPNKFANLPALIAFSRAFHEYGSRYIEQLGSDLKDATLQSEGQFLAAHADVSLDRLSPAREAIMWQKIIAAAGFLLIGMGDAHRQNLAKKLDAAKIPHAKVDEELRRQAKDINAQWAP